MAGKVGKRQRRNYQLVYERQAIQRELEVCQKGRGRIRRSEKSCASRSDERNLAVGFNPRTHDNIISVA